MGRSAASIQAQITALETYIASGGGISKSISANGVSETSMSMDEATKLLDSLYIQLGRANGSSPMISRGIILGLR